MGAGSRWSWGAVSGSGSETLPLRSYFIGKKICVFIMLAFIEIFRILERKKLKSRSPKVTEFFS